MPGPGTAFTGPLMTGSVLGSPPSTSGDYGLVTLAQRVTINQNGTSAVSATVLLPIGSVILSFDNDVTTAFNSATSAILSAGTAAAGTQYMSGVDVHAAAGRIAPAYTAAQLTNMNNIGANTSVVLTVTPTGATSAGQVVVTVRYLQTLQPGQGIL